jgi:hypothetical protein
MVVNVVNILPKPAESSSCSDAVHGMVPLAASTPNNAAIFPTSLDGMGDIGDIGDMDEMMPCHSVTNAAAQSQLSKETAAHDGMDSNVVAGGSAALIEPASTEPSFVHGGLRSTKSIDDDDDDDDDDGAYHHDLELAVPQVVYNEEEERSSPHAIQDHPGFFQGAVHVKPVGVYVAAAKAALITSSKQAATRSYLNRAVSSTTATATTAASTSCTIPALEEESRNARVKTAAQPISYLDVFGDEVGDEVGDDRHGTNGPSDVDSDCSFEPIQLSSLLSYRQLLPQVWTMTASPMEGVAASVGETIARPQPQYPAAAMDPSSVHLFLQRVAITSQKW